MDRGPQRSPSRPKKFGRIDPFCWIPVVSLVTIAALMMVSGAAPIGAALVAVAGLLLLFDSWVNRPDPEAAAAAARAARASRPPARRPARPESRPRPPRAEPSRGGSRGANPPPPPMRRPQQPPPRMNGRPVPRQVPPPPPRRPGPRSGAGA